MKLISFGVVVATVMWFGGCVAEEVYEHEREPADQVEGEALIASAVFSGTVTNEQGAPQAGVTVGINGISRVTDSAGRYFMSVTSVATGYRLSLNKSGFAPSSEFYAEGRTNLQHALRSGFVTMVNPAVNSTVVAGGVTVSLKANSLMTASGTSPVGMVQVTVAVYDPLRMPGDFTAVNAAGQQVALESVGAVFVGANDSVGQALELRSGMTSDAFIPVSVGAMPPCVFDGSCRIAMWKFDPSTGKWVEKTGAGIQVGSLGTQFTMGGGASLGAQAIPISSGGLGMWNADIEKRSPACTIIELVNFQPQCFGVGGKVTLNLLLSNSGGALIPRTDTMSSVTPFIVLYNISANVVEEVRVTLPPDAPSTMCKYKAISSIPPPAPGSGFPILSSSSGVTRFNAGAPWGGTGFPVNSSNMLINFTDVANSNHPCKSHVWFELQSL